jgi:hypothetical protein
LIKLLEKGAVPGLDVELADAAYLTVHDYSLIHTRATVAFSVSLPADRPMQRLAQSLSNDQFAALDKLHQKEMKAAEIKKREEALANMVKECPPAAIIAGTPSQILGCRIVAASAPMPDRVAAAEALGELKSRDGVLPLSAAADSMNQGLRTAALNALGKLGAPASAGGRSEQAAAAATPTAPPVRSFSLTSGPAEHWFISADVIVTSKDQFKMENDTLVLAEKPPAFYVGFGFLFGDLASTKRSVLGNLALKILVKGTKSPLDSVGTSLALRGEYLKKWGLSFEALSPFVAYTWTKEEGSVTRSEELRYGVALNIDKAVEWLK